jgi:hypothetical protein
MTRSHDPFEDLPEWKERRRLQEIDRVRQAGVTARDGHGDAHRGRGPEFAGAAGYGRDDGPHGTAAHGSAGGHGSHGDAAVYGAGHAAYGEAPASYGEGHAGYGAAHPGYGENLSAPGDGRGGWDARQAGDPGDPSYGAPPAWSEPLAPPVYDAGQGQRPHGGYDAGGYAAAGHRPPGEPDDRGYASVGVVWAEAEARSGTGRLAGYPLGDRPAAPGRLPEFGAPLAGDYPDPGGYQPSLRGGQYDAQPAFGYPTQQPSEPSLSDYRPHVHSEAGLPGSGGEAAADGSRFDEYGGGAATGDDEDYDAYDDEYDYDDDVDEGHRFSWKMLAAVVGAGVVIAGGGVVVYGLLSGGGSSGPAPIIKADQGPAKTAPADPGGRSFANQDSKLLGRLDSGASGTRSAALDGEGRNRVREVPTVKVAPDGRLILPREPQSVPAGGGEESSAAVPRVPGINIVDSLNGRGNGLDSLPPVIPKSEPTPQQAQPSPQLPAIVNGGDATARASTPTAPLIRNRDAGGRSNNLATAPGGAPPVPQKSAISTGWRMAGTPRAAVARAEPTVATASPTTTAATLGASSIADDGARQFVAVIATRATRMEALESFAELQQRHPQALSNHVPTVQKADLSSRGLGTMYRLLVGPAGSRQAANEVCASLKAGGYNGCWVKAN